MSIATMNPFISNNGVGKRSRTTHTHRRGSDDVVATAITNDNPRARNKSRSPSRSARNDAASASARTAAARNFFNPFPRNSGATSIRQSTSSHDSDLIDPSQRFRTSFAVSSQRSTNSRPSTPAASSTNTQKKDKGKEHHPKSHGSVDGSFAGPIAAAEFERMRKEIESLKSTVNEQKKGSKKQAKKIEELKAEIANSKTAREEQESQLQLLKSKHTRDEELIGAFETSLTCNICMEVLNKPFSLSPCGHTFCMQDLQEWFRKAPPTDDDMDVDQDDPDYLLYRQKTCPACRAIVTGRPLPVFLVRDLVSALLKAKYSGGPAGNGASAARRSSSPYISDDPWEGLFADEDDAEEDGDDEDESDAGGVPFGFLYSETDSEMDVHEDDSEYDSNGEPGAEEDNSAGDDEEEDGSSEGDEDSSDEVYYISPDYEEPYHQYMAGSPLAQRGCPLWLISTYRMRYTENNGLIAHLNSLDPDDVGIPPHGPTNRMHRLFLGWNIRDLDMHSSELNQRRFMTQTLEDYRSVPHRFSIHQRPNGCLDVWVLVRADQVDYQTDSE
ncbi:hypothetical protein FB446DRAFT_659601 [Lentinula raphanica]|nr:hypothetical protein FB446DRAFT_659601 [Lentinula raphanica]